MTIKKELQDIKKLLSNKDKQDAPKHLVFDRKLQLKILEEEGYLEHKD